MSICNCATAADAVVEARELAKTFEAHNYCADYVLAIGLAIVSSAAQSLGDAGVDPKEVQNRANNLNVQVNDVMAMMAATVLN